MFFEAEPRPLSLKTLSEAVQALKSSYQGVADSLIVSAQQFEQLQDALAPTVERTVDEEDESRFEAAISRLVREINADGYGPGERDFEVDE